MSKKVACVLCDKQVEENAAWQFSDGTQACVECFNEYAVACTACSAIINKHRDETFVHNGCYYCSDCYEEEFRMCDICNRAISVPDCEAYWVDDDVYCESCFYERYRYCEGCSERVAADEACYIDGDAYCEWCAEHVEENRVIKSARWRPAEFVYLKEPWENTLFLGVELEVEPHGDCEAQAFHDKFGKRHLYLKEDCSLGDGGFEIVTHPATLKAHRKFGWFEMLTWLASHGFRSYSTGTCGLHIHINRAFFGTRALINFALFVEKTRNYMLKFSGRTETQARHYCAFRGGDELEALERGDLNEAGNSRYFAVNLTNRKTVEFRLPRGTLHYQRFRAMLTLCEALAYYSKRISRAYLLHATEKTLWDNFVEHTRREGYQHLYRALVEKTQ